MDIQIRQETQTPHTLANTRTNHLLFLPRDKTDMTPQHRIPFLRSQGLEDPGGDVEEEDGSDED
jgi:hypothetical protein